MTALAAGAGILIAILAPLAFLLPRDEPAAYDPGPRVHRLTVFEEPEPAWSTWGWYLQHQVKVSPSPPPLPWNFTPYQPPPPPEPVYIEPEPQVYVESEPEPYVAPAPVQNGVEALICSYGWDCATALRVAACESGMNPSATNGRHVGLFQIDPHLHTWRSATGELWSAAGNVSAAWHLYLEQGWGPWACA